MVILLVFGVIGTINFCLVEWSFKRAAANTAANQLKQNGNGKLQIEIHSD